MFCLPNVRAFATHKSRVPWRWTRDAVLGKMRIGYAAGTIRVLRGWHMCCVFKEEAKLGTPLHRSNIKLPDTRGHCKDSMYRSPGQAFRQIYVRIVG